MNLCSSPASPPVLASTTPTTPTSTKQGIARARMARTAEFQAEYHSVPTGVAPVIVQTGPKRAAKDKGIEKRREPEIQHEFDEKDISQRYEESDPEEDIVLTDIGVKAMAPRRDPSREDNPTETDDEETDPDARREWRKT